MSDVTTRRLAVLVTGDLLADWSPQEFAEEVAGTSFCGSNGVLVPGCPVVQNVTVTYGEGDEVTLAAEFLAYDHVPAGDYQGDEVTEEFVSSYILGAGDYWFGHGDEFSPTTAQVLRQQ